MLASKKNESYSGRVGPGNTPGYLFLIDYPDAQKHLVVQLWLFPCVLLIQTQLTKRNFKPTRGLEKENG
jgi:hypothetical protein